MQMPQSLVASTRPGDLTVTILDQPLIDFGPEIAADLPNALRSEWLVERRIWMAYGSNTTYVRFTVVRSSGPLELELRQLVTYRDFHSLSRAYGWLPGFVQVPDGIEVRAFDGATPFRILCSGGMF